MAGRICPAERCPVIIAPGQRYCPQHAREYERRRGSAARRGYGARHQQLRARFQRAIDVGVVVRCTTCGTRLVGSTWDLGHSADRSGYVGPQCRPRNRSDGGQRGAAITNASA